jgi:hypothetical protein
VELESAAPYYMMFVLVSSSCQMTRNFFDGFLRYAAYFSSYALMSHLQLAELQKIDGADNWPCRSGGIPKTLRFDPATSQTSGLFVAKFTKLPS